MGFRLPMKERSWRVDPSHACFFQVLGTQGDISWPIQSGDEGFDLGAVEISPLNPLRNPSRPVYLACAQVEGNAVSIYGEEGFDLGSVEVGPLNPITPPPI